MAKQYQAVPSVLEHVRYEKTSATVVNPEVIDASQGRRWIRLPELATGFGSNAALNFIFDWLLYPFVIFKLGLLWGGLTMSLASFVACIGLLWLYDLLKRDWLGIEAVKVLRDNPGKSAIRRLLSRSLRWGDGPVFVLLSFYFDPFVTVAYMRRGQFAGMRQREWIIFVGSWALSNGWWIMACYGGVSVLRWLVR